MLEHANIQASSQRVDRPKKHVGTCLESLFRLFDDTDYLEGLTVDFPDSPVLAEIEAMPRMYIVVGDEDSPVRRASTVRWIRTR